jgi:hypothetical protein
MATNVSFVDFEYLQANSPLYSNLDPSSIDWLIPASQDKNIERLLGSSLYNKLKSDIQASGTTTYKSLIDDYISPALVFFIASDALAFNQVSFTNKGILMKSSENSEQATEEAFKRYKGNLDNFAEYYGQRLVDHLCANKTLYPEYATGNAAIDSIVPEKNAYKTTFYIPK